MSCEQSLMKKFKLDWVVINSRGCGGHSIIIIAPCYDGKVSQEEILKRHIPFGFILLIKLLNPFTPVVVRGLITQRELDSSMGAIKAAWEAAGG